jgi:hypothetical protein
MMRLVWKGKDNDTRLHSSVAADGVSWETPGQAGMDRASLHGPGLASVQGLDGFPGQEVLMVWRGAEDDTHLFSSSHGVGGWTSQQALGEDFRSSDGPSVFGVGRHVFMAWKADSGLDLLWSRFVGGQWQTPESLAGGSSSHGPALVGVGEVALAAWKGQPGDSRIFSSFFNGRRWDPQEPAAGGDFGTAARPGLGRQLELGGVVMAWRGKDEDRRLHFSKRNGNEWGPQQPVNGGAFGSEHGPALAGENRRLFMVWRGTGPDTQMFRSSFDGTTWTGQEDVRRGDAGTSHGPALASFTRFNL